MNGENSENRSEKRRRAAFGIFAALLAAAAAASVAAVYFDAPRGLWETVAALPETAAGRSGAAVFVLLAAATFISEDLACLGAGALAARGETTLGAAVAACAVGIFVGDLLLYLAGRVFGRGLLESRFGRRWITARALDAAAARLARDGLKAVFISRFVSGLRLPIYFAAGALRVPFPRFALYFAVAVAVWTPLPVAASYALGAEAAGRAFVGFGPAAVFAFGLAGLYLLVRILPKLATRRGRRLMRGAARRWTRWEFWPLAVFYAPVVVYIAYLAVRYRRPTLFTCVNPSMPASGFVGESKDAILRGLARSAAARPFLPAHRFLPKELPADEKMRRALDFIERRGFSWPVVVKPDVGERGAGVAIVGDADALAERLAAPAEADLLVQEFAPGAEASVFYYRFPKAAAGRIFALTEKRFPFVTGDGRASVEELVLRDERAVCLAEKYFERLGARVAEVPADGARVSLIDIGTHSRGAIFLDGEHLRTPALERVIDEICRGYDGFYFGRFDIRAASLEDLSAGRNFRIVELNGVTSEATGIYDPKNTLRDAYRTLFRQWRIAFAIGAENYKLGIEPTGLGELARIVAGRPPRIRRPPATE